MDIERLRPLVEQIKEYAAESDHDDMFPEREFELVTGAGMLHIPLNMHPYSYKQFQTKYLVEVLTLLGKASLPVGRIYEGHINALQLIEIFGSSVQKEQYFGEVYRDGSLFGVWNTQADDGVRIKDIGGGKYVMQGSKTFCSGGGWINRPLVTAELTTSTGKSWQMCIIPSEKVKDIVCDRSFWKPMGMRASASYKMDFSGIVLDQTDLLGVPDAYYKEPYFSGGAVRFAAVQLGGAQAILAETHQFLRELNRTGDPFQRARIAEIAYLVETGNMWVNRAAIKSDKWEVLHYSTEELIGYVNMTRTVINELCLRCMQLSERCVGARGLMRPYALERIHRDLTTYLKQPFPDGVITSIGAYVLEQQDISTIWK